MSEKLKKKYKFDASIHPFYIHPNTAQEPDVHFRTTHLHRYFYWELLGSVCQHWSTDLLKINNSNEGRERKKQD